MDASIIWENPGLTMLGVLAGIFLILLLPIASALRRSRETRRDVSPRQREPSIFDDRGYDDRDYGDRQDYGSYFARQESSPDRWGARDDRDDDVPAGVFGREPRQRKRRKTVSLSAPARAMWFVVGVCVGAGGLALWWYPPSNLLSFNPLPTILALFEPPDPPPVADTAPPPADNKVQDRLAEPGSDVASAPMAIGDGGGAEVDEMIENFVTTLQAQLPMAVGPGITMVNADSGSNTVALGFTIAQTVADEDAPKLQEELESRFKSSVCATQPDPTNIHGLNKRGVAFLINYVDLLGKNVAGLTVAPNFCSDPA